MHGGAGAVGGSSQVDSGGELASALATVTTLHKMRERANRGPQICGRKVSRRLGQCGIPTVWDPVSTSSTGGSNVIYITNIGSAFDTTNELTGSVSGALGANSVPLSVDSNGYDNAKESL